MQHRRVTIRPATCPPAKHVTGVPACVLACMCAEELERLALQYLGTLPPSETVSETVEAFEKGAAAAAMAQPSIPPMPSPGKDLYIEIKDSDPRAVAYVAGRAPNRWGTMADGSKVLSLLDARGLLCMHAHAVARHVRLSLLPAVWSSSSEFMW
jgi:hypothetical protein